MISKKSIIERAKMTILMEAEAINNLVNYIDDSFLDVVNLIANSKGRVVVTGIGKSGVIGLKIVATFNSTGTPSIFMHAADAIHGDLGIIQKDDIVICISKSGNSPEIKSLIPFLKKEKNILIGMTSDLNSFLSTNSDFIINTPVSKEACPNNLAPTTSTSVQLAMGDALAMCLLEQNKFEAKDFAKYHPGGNLGKKLFLTLGEMINSKSQPTVDINDPLKNVINEITSKMLGATAVLNVNKVIGIITDGDIRRMLEENETFKDKTASDIMTYNPICLNHNVLAVEATKMMNKKNINHVIVLKNSNYLGIIHVLDLIKEGIN
ncbi:MAG: D-arabinose 5-phosphate isomerase [Flavobacteriaceae bacterium TMED116]|nr:MAG: D-arabinose 5-phosphate isomerase [Flavobacteriaceae bacterium TMED116]